MISSYDNRLALEGPGTAGPPGRRVPPGSAALRAELEARQQARGIPRFRYVGHVDVERGVLEIPHKHKDATRNRHNSRFSPDSHSAKGPSFHASSSMNDHPPMDTKPYSIPDATIRSQDPQRPSYALGPDNRGNPPVRDARDNMFDSQRDSGARPGQGGPAYGGTSRSNPQMDFSPPPHSRGFDNREVDRRPPIGPPVRQNYDDRVRARPTSYSGAGRMEPPYSAFPHDGPRSNSMQEDFRQVFLG